MRNRQMEANKATAAKPEKSNGGRFRQTKVLDGGELGEERLGKEREGRINKSLGELDDRNLQLCTVWLG